MISNKRAKEQFGVEKHFCALLGLETLNSGGKKGLLFFLSFVSHL